MSFKYVKIYGMMRTCTNYVEWLLKHNFECKVLRHDLGDKHQRIKLPDWDGDVREWFKKKSLREVWGDELERIKEAYETNRLRYCVCTKNPFAWIVSVRKFWKSYRERTLTSCIHSWNNYNKHWVSELESHNCLFMICRHEDLLESVIDFLWKIKSDLQLQFLVGERLRTNDKAVNQYCKSSDQKFRKTYYENFEYMNVLTPNDRHEIVDALDFDVVERLQYTELIKGFIK